MDDKSVLRFGRVLALAALTVVLPGCCLFICQHPSHDGQAQARRDMQRGVAQLRWVTNQFDLKGYKPSYLIDECVAEAYERTGGSVVKVAARSVREAQRIEGYNSCLLDGPGYRGDGSVPVAAIRLHSARGHSPPFRQWLLWYHRASTNAPASR